MNDYYEIAFNELLYLEYTLGTGFYNPISAQAQQIAEKMLKSVAERECVGIEKLMKSHNLRALYTEIHKVDASFELNKDKLSTLKDLYFDTRYPGDNYVEVDYETCADAISTMYAVIKEVNKKRESVGLPVHDVEEKQLEKR